MGKSNGETGPDPQEPLAGIAGIGPKRAEALARVGVPDRAALARCEDPGDLAARLRGEGVRGVGADEVARWVAAARAAEPPSSQNDIRGFQSPEPPEELREGWTQTASFTIWFAYRSTPGGEPEWRSYVYHEGGAGEWEVLEGLERWATWISDRAGLPGTGATIEAAPAAPVEVLGPEVPPMAESDLDVTTIDITRRAGIPPGIRARIGLRVPPALQATEAQRGSLTYSALVEIRDPESGTVLAERIDHGQLPEGPAERDIECTLAFPPPGRYRLHTRIWLGPDGHTAERDGPELTVA
jgi:hypothetical protein